MARTAAASGALGVNIVELDTGETVFSYNPDEPRVIASNSKLFTTAATLDALGPGYIFETRLMMRGAVDRGALHGDLGVVGSGDPQISGREYGGDPYGAFRPWAAALRARGVERITGDLYLADGLFEPTQIHPEWPRDQLTDWYEAPIASLAFSDNCILVRVSPGAAGHAAVVEIVPPVPIVRVDNSALTTAKRRGTRLFVGRTGDLLTVRGSIDANSGPFETWVTVPDPVLYFGLGLRGAARRGGDRGRRRDPAGGAAPRRGLGAGGRPSERPRHRHHHHQQAQPELLRRDPLQGARRRPLRRGELAGGDAGDRGVRHRPRRAAGERPHGGRLRHEPQQPGVAAGDHPAAAPHVLPPRGARSSPSRSPTAART